METETFVFVECGEEDGVSDVSDDDAVDNFKSVFIFKTVQSVFLF
jgi:hypothetical protein